MKDQAKQSVNWWKTLPGILTAVSGVIVAISGLIVAMYQAGLIGSKNVEPPADKVVSERPYAMLQPSGTPLETSAPGSTARPPVATQPSGPTQAPSAPAPGTEGPDSSRGQAEDSTDRGHPTRLTTNEIRRMGLGEPVSHYYSFMGEPGDVKVTLDVSGGKVKVRLFDPDWKELLSVSDYAPGSSSNRKVEHLQMRRRQSLIMQVEEEILYDDVVKSFMVRLDGAVSLH